MSNVLLKERKEIYSQIVHLERYLLYLEKCCKFPELLKKRNTLMNDFENLRKKVDNPSGNITDVTQQKLQLETINHAIDNINSLLNTIAGEYVIEEIFNNSEQLKALGVYLNPDRQKFFSEDHGYTSMHFSIESSKLEGWVSELQDRSSSIEYLAIHSHDTLPGKKRHLIDLPTNFEPHHKLNEILEEMNYINMGKCNLKKTPAKRKLIKDLCRVSPNYTIYRYNGYIKRYNMKQNVHHYYNSLLRNNLDYSRKIDMVLDDREECDFLPKLLSEQKSPKDLTLDF